jgi:hypothetical protein
MLRLKTHYYQQFDADYALEVPAEGYGGWQTAEVEISPEHTAVVVMHAWDLGTPEEFPGQFRACNCLPRTYQVCREVFPRLLAAVRASPIPILHVVAGSGYYEQYPGWARTLALAGPDPEPPPEILREPVYERLQEFRQDRVFPGAHNRADCEAAWKRVRFPREAEPQGEEGIARDGRQLLALCRAAKINHLIYAGFNVDWCLLMSPGGMVDMSRYGLICSVFRDAVTAVENKETARSGLGKEVSLWRVSVGFGFVFDTADFIRALARLRSAAG